MMTSTPSPKSPEISEKTKKYDRQLRLWGDHGQEKLEKSHICLINANQTGTELLKSLILPGCGRITVIDGHKVSQADIGNNFFLDSDSYGKNRAACTVNFLLDLNGDVFGEAIEEHPETLLKQNPGFFNQYSCVIGSQLSERVLISLSETLWENNIPFVYVHSIGFLGWIRVQVPEHKIIESHPEEGSLLDLRLDDPFPELITHMKGVELSDKSEVLKTPWLVLLYKAIEQYMDSRQKNGNDQMETDHIHPCFMSSKQKREFKDFFVNFLRNIGLTEQDELFDEALKATNTALTQTKVPQDVKAILSDPKAAKLERSKFWVLCSALKEFVEANSNLLPVRGIIPDMTADSEKYISLQNVYRDKAARDADDVMERAQNLLKQANVQGLSILGDEVRLFCKESLNLKVIRGTSFAKELTSSPKPILQELTQNMEDCDADKTFYLLLRGLLKFHGEYNSYPGVSRHEIEPDITRFKGIMTRLLNEWNTSLCVKEDYIHEVCRYGGAEVPSIAAFLGGCGAHEVIKIVTSQYVPLNNTLIYNGINCTTTTFQIQ